MLFWSRLMARLIIQKIRKTKLKTFPFETRVINIADTFLLFATGMVASIFIFKFIAFSLAAFPYGFIVHSVLIITSAVLMGTTLQFVVKNKKHSQLKILILTLALFCGLFLFSGLGIFYPYVVTRSAHNIAAGNSYCIGLNKRSRSLNSLEDLTLLTMDKSGFGHHAFLLVEKEDSTLEPYHWSYFQSKFLPRIINWTNDNKPSIPCRPAPDFIKKVPLTSHTIMEDMVFYFHDNFLKIPKEYAPHVSSNYISIAVQAPSFDPVTREKGRLYASMEVRSREWMENLHKDYEGLPITGKIGNLNEIKNAKNGIDWYYRFNENSQLETVAGCYSSRTPETACQHRFYRNGAMYTLDHSRELLPQSDEMERILFNLFESFKEN